MAQKLTNRFVLVGDVVQFVVIPVAVQAQGSQHQNFPQIHAGSAGFGVHIPGYDGFHDLEDFIPGFPVGINRLQTQKQLRYLIPARQIDFDARDGCLSDFELIVDHFSHSISPRGFSGFYSKRLIRQNRSQPFFPFKSMRYIAFASNLCKSFSHRSGKSSLLKTSPTYRF